MGLSVTSAEGVTNVKVCMMMLLRLMLDIRKALRASQSLNKRLRVILMGVCLNIVLEKVSRVCIHFSVIYLQPCIYTPPLILKSGWQCIFPWFRKISVLD